MTMVTASVSILVSVFAFVLILASFFAFISPLVPLPVQFFVSFFFSASTSAAFVFLVVVFGALPISVFWLFAVSHLGNDMWQMWLLAKEVRFIELFSEHNEWAF